MPTDQDSRQSYNVQSYMDWLHNEQKVKHILGGIPEKHTKLAHPSRFSPTIRKRNCTKPIYLSALQRHHLAVQMFVGAGEPHFHFSSPEIPASSRNLSKCHQLNKMTSMPAGLNNIRACSRFNFKPTYRGDTGRVYIW